MSKDGVAQVGIIEVAHHGNLEHRHCPPKPAAFTHLRSRHEVGQILRESGVETIEFRASAVIGAGSLSFELVEALTDRLPVMICPRWLATHTQPIAIDDVLAYLLAARDLPANGSRLFEIGGADVVTYGDMIREHALSVACSVTLL